MQAVVALWRCSLANACGAVAIRGQHADAVANGTEDGVELALQALKGLQGVVVGLGPLGHRLAIGLLQALSSLLLGLFLDEPGPLLGRGHYLVLIHPVAIYVLRLGAAALGVVLRLLQQSYLYSPTVGARRPPLAG